MATYAIGDIQGCYDALRTLLDHLHFDQEKDRLWLAGDLVNRGRQSLAVLRFIKGLGSRAITVLGNHDLHLLAVTQGNISHCRDNSLDEILYAPDRDELVDWLRRQPLLYHSEKKQFTLLHAGLPPHWSMAEAQIRAKEVEAVLQGDGFHELMKHLYGNHPANWSDNLSELERLRFIINCLTRLRYCRADGTLELKEKGRPGSQAHGLIPWFDVPGRVSAADRIVCGHWSTLGFNNSNNVWSLDTGCLWGGHLTALSIRKNKPKIAMQIKCPSFVNYRLFCN